MSKYRFGWIAMIIFALFSQESSADIASQLSAAERGDKDAQFGMSVRYSQGNGVLKDETKAAYWARKAAEQGQTAAMLDMGTRLWSGRGVTKNPSDAVQWFQKCATKCEDGRRPEAYYFIGIAYRTGVGVPKNDQLSTAAFAKGVTILKKLVDSGNATPFGYGALGQFYWEGDGVPKDIDHALILYNKAADLGSTDAMKFLGSAYLQGKSVPKDEKKAHDYFQMAVDKGDVSANLLIGNVYFRTKDYRTAEEYYRKVVDAGAATASEATRMLGIVAMLEGENGDPDGYRRAAVLFAQAADSGSVLSVSALASIYVSARGVNRDYAKALELAQKADAQNDFFAPMVLANIYLKGYGVASDYKKAADYYGIANTRYSTVADAPLGKLYEEGKGVTRDCSKAADLYKEISASDEPSLKQGGLVGLGHLYESGCGVERDYSKALNYYKDAIKLYRDTDPEFYLSGLYRAGNGTPKDVVEAYAWIELSVRDCSDPADSVERTIARTALKKGMSKDQIAKAMRRADQIALENPH